MARIPRTVYAGYGEDSQLYIYRDGNGPFVCCFCLARGVTFQSDTGSTMADHLSEHVSAGHRIPARLDAKLRGEGA